MPSEKYAHGPEIREHSRRIAEHYGLYDDALFSTVVTDLSWDDERARWTVRTDRGDAFTARFVAMGIGPLHANLISNVPHNFAESGRTIAAVIAHALERGAERVEVTEEAENDWVELLLSGPRRLLGGPDCTPGYYNNEGVDAGPAGATRVGYPEGASAYFAYLDAWRSSGRFEGLVFS